MSNGQTLADQLIREIEYVFQDSEDFNERQEATSGLSEEENPVEVDEEVSQGADADIESQNSLEVLIEDIEADTEIEKEEDPVEVEAEKVEAADEETPPIAIPSTEEIETLISNVVSSRLKELENSLTSRFSQSTKSKAKQTAEAVNFSEKLYSNGSLIESVIPQKDLVEFIISLTEVPSDDNDENFCENYGGDSMYYFFKKLMTYMLKDMPKQVSLDTEMAGPKSYDYGQSPKMESYRGSKPYDYAVDDSYMELHNRALDYAEKHNVSYEAALTKVI